MATSPGRDAVELESHDYLGSGRMINWEAIGTIAEVLGAVAVVATLLDHAKLEVVTMESSMG